MTNRTDSARPARDPADPEGAVTGPNRYVIPKHVRFGHCDPAGIVYYPRYFELLHDAKEDFFREALGFPFLELIGRQRLGFPIVRLEADFLAPSRLGEVIEIAVSVGRIGRSSLELDYECECAVLPQLNCALIIL